MTTETFQISIKGKQCRVPAWCLENVVVITKGAFARVAEIHDEYWLEAATLPDPIQLIKRLQQTEHGPDIFTFAQRVPDTQPRFAFYMEWDNVAVAPVSSYEAWFKKQISSASRRNIRASEKKGVEVRAAEFDEEYIRGIMSIYNESPIRHKKRFWHYGKDFTRVRSENGTYRERSTFIGAYLDDELIGYMKIVWDRDTAAIMQILSKSAHLDKRPNNAMLSEAVRLCGERKIGYLLYESFVYGGNTESSLTRFKEANGFIRMDIPRYYVPLTRKGRWALHLGLHKDAREFLPSGVRRHLRKLRDYWYAGGNLSA